MPLTREEMLDQYGVDLDEEGSLDKLNNANAGGGVADHLKSAVVGAVTTPTDFINFFPTVTSAIAAGARSYTHGTKFVDEFAKQTQIPGAEENTQKHLNDIASAWRQQNPQLSEEDILAGIADYQKSKPYEDFRTSQLGNTYWLAAKAKDTVRGLLGDERPDSERSWTEGAAEAIGGALLPGPVGWANSARGAVANVPIVGRAANSLLGRGALRTAEIFTPLTMPYTGTNVAVNAAAGIALDQAGRALTDRPTAFTPDNSDPNGIGALAATGGVAGALGAVIGVVRGRTHALQGQSLSDAARALQQPNMQGVNQQIANPQVPGQAGMTAGAERQTGPTPYADTLDPITGGQRHLKTQVLDESSGAVNALRDTTYADTGDMTLARAHANAAERLFEDNFGPVLNDRARAAADADMTPFYQALDAMPGGRNGPNARAAVEGARADSHRANHAIKHDELLMQVNDARRALQNLQQPGNPNSTPNRIGAALRLLHMRQTAFQRHAQDVPDARSALPDRSQMENRVLADAFVNDQRPFMVNFRNALRTLSTDVAEGLHASGRISDQQLVSWRTRNPYYIPLLDDPLQGATGMTRFWRSIVNTARAAYTNEHSNAASVVGHEGVIQSLDRVVRRGAGAPGGPESRITRPLDVPTSLKLYAKGARIDAALTHARNSITRMFTQDPYYGGQSGFQQAGHVRSVRQRPTQEWFGGEQINSNFVVEATRRPGVTIEWDQGRFRLWEWGDLDFARALRHQPTTMHGLMRFGAEMNKWFKHFTTGFGAPIFAPKAAAYNMLVGAITKSSNRAFGMIDYRLRQILPQRFANATLGRMYDPTVIAGAPYHIARGVVDLQIYYGARWMGSRLAAESGAFGALARAMGPRAYQDLINRVTRIGQWAHETATVQLHNAGMAADHGLHQGVRKASDAYDMMAAQVPRSMRSLWSFYKDGLNAVYMYPQRMFYTQNYGLLHRQYGGNIPGYEMERLISETRHLGGNMTKVAGSKMMRDAEAITPYLTQTKLGTYHLLRNMASPETASFVLPRLAQMMALVGASIWWRTHWNEESADDLWNRTSETDRYRYAYVPHPKIYLQGWDTPFSRDLFWKIPIAPDFAALVASTTAFMQATGAIPSGVTPRPLSENVWPVFLDNLMPGMPPAAQAVLAMGGIKLDPQTADTRGGNIFRSFNANFRAGPQAEAVSNAGQITNTTSLMLNALMGAMGSQVAQGLEVALHASKYDNNIKPGNVLSEKASREFGSGLHKAVNGTFTNMKNQLSDVPLLWQGKEKYTVMTSHWKFVNENNNHIRSIQGMRDTSLGKASMERRSRDAQIGGVPVQPVTDAALLQVANNVADFNKTTGPLGQLRKQYRDYANDVKSFRAQHNMPPDVREKNINIAVKAQQDNMKEQGIAMQWLEQELAKKYGPALAPRLRGREFSLKTLDTMMRESVGGGVPDAMPAQAGEPQ